MTYTASCALETALIRAFATGGLSDELRNHVARCPLCAETIELTT